MGKVIIIIIIFIALAKSFRAIKPDIGTTLPGFVKCGQGYLPKNRILRKQFLIFIFHKGSCGEIHPKTVMFDISHWSLLVINNPQQH